MVSETELIFCQYVVHGNLGVNSAVNDFFKYFGK